MKRLVALISFLWLLCSLSFAQTRGLPDFSELAEKQGPAVVNISTTQVIRGQAQMMPFPFDEKRSGLRVFQALHPPFSGRGIPRDFENKSLGSGFIISGDGYILTNAHVVDGADEVTVRLTDKREFKAKTIGADKRTDVALIKIEASGLPTVKLGDPAQLKVGEWVVAIGSPFGFRQFGDSGHRFGQGARVAAGKLRPLHPDRRRHQSRQFGRAVVQHARRGGRHQFADL
jgi:serine protease Do